MGVKDVLGQTVSKQLEWLQVRNPVEANFLSGVLSPLTSAEASEKSNRWLWKEMCVSTGELKPRNTFASPTTMICMTLAVKAALNPNTTNQQLGYCRIKLKLQVLCLTKQSKLRFYTV